MCSRLQNLTDISVDDYRVLIEGYRRFRSDMVDPIFCHYEIRHASLSVLWEHSRELTDETYLELWSIDA